MEQTFCHIFVVQQFRRDQVSQDATLHPGIRIKVAYLLWNCEHIKDAASLVSKEMQATAIIAATFDASPRHPSWWDIAVS